MQYCQYVSEAANRFQEILASRPTPMLTLIHGTKKHSIQNLSCHHRRAVRARFMARQTANGGDRIDDGDSDRVLEFIKKEGGPKTSQASKCK